MRKIQLVSALSLACLSLLATGKVKADTIDTNSSQATTVETKSDANSQSTINDYINNNNLTYSGVDNQVSKSTFTKGGNYRKGRPEGIVVHETAEPNISAQQWADKFNGEWQKRQTYVHAFVDHSTVIQTAPTDKTVWGAGYYANQRFIQVELCEENNLHDFAQSVNNDATYIANLLHQYGLSPILADKSGTGTVWSHHDVSRYLGDTTHTDPDDYFAKYGYSMNQFFDLINQKYYGTVDKPEKTDVIETNTIVKINYAGPGKVAIWNNYDGQKALTGKYLSNSTSWKAFKVGTDKNGSKWYNLGGNQWVSEQYILVGNQAPQAHVVPQNTVKNIVTINYAGPGKVAVWSSFDDNKKITEKYLSNNTSWKVLKIATDKTGRLWYNLGGNQWIDSQYIK